MAVGLLAPSKIDVIEDIEALSSNSGPSQAELAIFLLLLSWLCLLFVLSDRSCCRRRRFQCRFRRCLGLFVVLFHVIVVRLLSSLSFYQLCLTLGSFDIHSQTADRIKSETELNMTWLVHE